MTNLIEAVDDGRVRTLTLNRPSALNAFNDRMFDALADAIIAADAAEHVAVVVLTGAGRAFSAGADLTAAPAGSTIRHGFPGMLEQLVSFSKPLLLAINGLGVGIGATICGLADVVFMSSEARLRCPFSRLGLVPEAGSTALFPELMGRQAATWFLLSSEWLDADACKAAGLVYAVCKPDELLPTAMAHARTLAALPLASLRGTKELIMAPRRDTLRAVFKAENAALAALRGGPANLEAIAAFRDKREPDFSQLG